MPRPGKTRQRGYSHAYRKARAAILGPAGNGDLPEDPPCHWCHRRPATTADHDPPIVVAGHPHLRLVPACGPCNYGRKPLPSLKAVNPSRRW